MRAADRQITALRLLKETFNVLNIAWWAKEYIKETNTFIMYELNSAYQDKYLTPNNFTKYDYIGNPDSVVWDTSTCEAFRRNDLICYNNKTKYIFSEQFIVGGKLHTELFMKKYIFDDYSGREFITGISIDAVDVIRDMNKR